MEAWAPGGQILQLPGEAGSLALLWFPSLAPSLRTYLHTAVLSGVPFTYRSQMCKSGVSGLMASDSSNIF